MDDRDRFFHDLDLLEECRTLLLSDSMAKARMALILLDSFADALLYRRLERAYAESDEYWYWAVHNPRFPKSVRKSAKKNFGERLKLARHPFQHLVPWGSEPPFASELEAEIILIGHSYRNAAYHRDAHNAAVVVPLGRLVFGAVATAFAQVHDYGLVIGRSAEWTERLAQLGVDATEPMLTVGDAARLAAARLQEGMEVAVDEIAARLASDLEERVDEVNASIEWLPLDEAGLDAMLAEHEFWDKHGADDELLRLIEIADPVPHALRLGIKPTAETIDNAKRADAEVRARIIELKKTAGPATVSLADRDAASGAAVAIRASDDLGFLLRTYRAADAALGVLEEYVDEAVTAYDRQIQHEIDLARGK